MQNGNHDAFNDIYKRCCGYVAFVCSTFCDNKEDAEEVVQDTFVIAFKKVDELRSESLLAYLRKIAIHECFRKRKASRRRQEVVVTTEVLPENHMEFNDDFLPEESLQNKESRKEILQIIRKLPKNQREMIYLYYYADTATVDIAELMECSIDSVYKTLSRARKTIKTKLDDKKEKGSKQFAALIPISALLVLEEQAFIASYVPAACIFGTASAAVAATTTAAAKTAIWWLAAACVVSVGVAAIVTYLALVTPLDRTEYSPVMMYYAEPESTQIPEATAEPVPELIAQPTGEPIPESTPIPTIEPEPTQIPEATAEPAPELIPQPTDEPIPESTPIPTIESGPTQIPEATAEPAPELIPQPTDEPISESTPIPMPIPIIESEPTQVPEATTEPVQYNIDRTVEILAMLAAVGSAEDVTNIIEYFGFAFDTQIFFPPDLFLRFYVLDAGSGDILIGTAINEDGSGWNMKFEHFDNGRVLFDRADLFRWMEG